jgi:hypothetical protein
MHSVSAEAPLLAAWSIRMVIVWPRFILSMLVMLGLIFASAYAYQGGNAKKKKK